MRIPEAKIEEIRAAANIVDVISGYIHLKKKGDNYWGVCPFHNDKNPSMSVSNQKQIFKCFSCNAGGNVYKFLMDYKNISFIEAVEEVAEFAGIQLEYEKDYNPEEQSENEKLFDINVQAAKFFVKQLKDKTIAAEAQKYLENRKIKEKTQRTFGIGFAPSGWDNFVKFAEKNKIDLERARTLGLVDKKENGNYYDKFRGRIIFPILSPNGRVIAFGGRIFEKSDTQAKYLNSPESLIYQKRKSLYGLFHSKDEIRKLDKAILVEGYMDLIALYQQGIKNVIASSGTSLTDEQVKLLSRYTKNIVVLFDADEAGQKAAMRSIEILLNQDFEVKLLTLPDGEDPDSFVNKYGKDAFTEELKKAVNFLEFEIESFRKRGDLEDPVMMTEAIRQLVKSSMLVSDDLKRNIYLKTIAKKFNIRESLIELESDKYLKQRAKETRPKINTVLQKKESTETNSELKSKKHALERKLIKLMFEGDAEITGHIFDNILPEDFNVSEFSRIAQVVYDEYLNDNVTPASIIEKFEDEELKNIVLDLTFEKNSISNKWGDEIVSPELIKKYEANDTVKSYILKQLDEQILRNNEILKNLSKDDEILELMKEIKELTLEKQKVLNEPEFFKKI